MNLKQVHADPCTRAFGRASARTSLWLGSSIARDESPDEEDNERSTDG